MKEVHFVQLIVVFHRVYLILMIVVMVHVEKIDEVQEYVQFHLHFLLDLDEMIYLYVLMMIVVVVDIQLI
jgi:hypothetical protein